MKIRVRSLVAHAVLCASVSVAIACSRQAGAPESALAPAAVPAGQQARTSLPGVVLPLVEGSFAIVNRDGDGVAGTYAGTAAFSAAGAQTSSFVLQVTSGSGAFTGAAGSLVISGAGSFTDEGPFVADGDGQVTLAGGRRANLVLSLRGRSYATCPATRQIAITQSATGVMARAGRVSATLSHGVGGSGCGVFDTLRP